MKLAPLSFTLAVAVSLGWVGPAGAGDDEPLSFPMERGSTVAARDVPIDARVGNLTARSGSASGARRLTSATVRQDLLAGRVSATIVLDEVPTEATVAELQVGFGYSGETGCAPDELFHTTSTVAPADGFTRSGRTITFDVDNTAARYADWNCAGVALGSGATTYSGLGGPLRPVYATPRLALLKPEILGKRVSRVKLVRNQWHVVNVPVRNTSSRVSALGAVVRGKGKGLKVRPASIGEVFSGFNQVAKLKVRAVGRRIGPLKIVVTARNAPADRRTVKTRIVRAPRPPAPGSYRSSDGDVVFRIVGGRTPKVVGFRTRTRTTCGGYPDFPTYSMDWYDFPRSAIGGGGIVDRTQSKRLYSVSLRMKVVGGKATSGRFSYGGPNRCRAIEQFTARRIGR